MSRADNAEVLQGRLGWESGDISEANPEELQPHPKNTEIYGDTDDIGDLDETFKESVAEKGVLEPLVITNGKEIISGHRRWLAAKDAGLDEVPVRYSEFDNDLAEREALIEFNRQREKTPGQMVNEFEEIFEIEKKRAAKRRQAAQNNDTANEIAESETFPGQGGEARDKAAEKINADVSGKTLEKGKKVKDKAESDDEPEEVQEAAQEAWDGLQSGEESFNSAYQTVKDAENDTEEESEVVETPELPESAYDVIYADPPWRYDFSETGNREIENHYSTMRLSDIKDLDIPAGDDCVLYLWATAPKLREALAVVDAWGFEYKTNLVWDKQKIGMGYWARGQHELLLVCTRGDVSPPETGNRRSSVINAERGEHSEKPECVADMVAEQHPGAELIELFARDNHDAFDAWGAEAPEEVAADD